jgi:hypothetical protein
MEHVRGRTLYVPLRRQRGYHSSLFRGWEPVSRSDVSHHSADLAVAGLSLNGYSDIAGPSQTLW